ncbi:hypothetical protein BDV12DRAFT_171435, partial [Aspergillus spectabilis]
MSQYTKDESIIQEALNRYIHEKRENPKLSQAKIARMYNIDPQVIKRRLKGIGPRSARAHPSPTLVRNAANTILSNAHSSATKTPREVSKMFAYQFMKCQKDFF